MKKLYEGMFLFDSNLASKDWPGLEQHVQDLFQRHSIDLVHSERWPDRKLSYEIRGCKKGSYYLTYFNAPPASIDALRRDCDLSDRVIRVLFLYDEALAEECERRQDAEKKDAEKKDAEKKDAEKKDDPPPESDSKPDEAAEKPASDGETVKAAVDVEDVASTPQNDSEGPVG